jgi:PAS domain S-box-containing protein
MTAFASDGGEAKYRLLYESMFEAFARVDMSGRIVESNEVFRSLVGYGADELSSLGYRDLTPERWRAMEAAIVEREVLPRGHSEVYEKEYRRKDGTIVPVELRTFLLRDDSGRAEGMWAIVRDIGERKRIEGERARQTELARRELESLAYSVSHDLKAPLRAVSGFSAVLLEEHAAGLDDEGRRLLGIVRENARRMEALISAILELSRVGRAELRPCRVDMRAMANSMYCEVASPEERARFSISIGEIPDAEGDPALLRIVWAKLLSNAIKYSSRSERREIRVDSASMEAGVRYRVSDSGVGFDPAYSEKLFNLFRRLHSAEEYDGTGAGLAIARRVVEMHGGSVGAESREGGGSIFWFSLPAPPSSAGKVEP